jgi:hypothetical protein
MPKCSPSLTSEGEGLLGFIIDSSEQDPVHVTSTAKLIINFKRGTKFWGVEQDVITNKSSTCKSRTDCSIHRECEERAMIVKISRRIDKEHSTETLPRNWVF